MIKLYKAIFRLIELNSVEEEKGVSIVSEMLPYSLITGYFRNYSDPLQF